MNKEQMLKIYYAAAAAHKYIVGFILNGLLYYVVFDNTLPDAMLKLGRTSSKRGGVQQIRVRLDTKMRTILRNRAICLGKAEIMDFDDSYNKGEHFERIITERVAGKKWVKDSTPFWISGDVEINGEQYQIKFDNAELTNEKALAKLAP